MSNMPFQVQLSADQTAASIIGFSWGTLAALASDNVHPLAQAACLTLGASLAIHSDTTKRIRAIVVPATTPVWVDFVKTYVGFNSKDTAVVLGSSQEGLRFLALATALTSALPLFDAARAIEIMLPSVISTPDLVPSTGLIKTLLARLEPRCHRTGFATQMASWQLHLRQVAVPLIETQDNVDHFYADTLLGTHPSPEMVSRLVDAFRQIGRIGASSVTGVTIRACTAVPWIIVFTNWSMGAPPRICFDGPSGGDIFPPTNSLVTLFIPRRAGDIRGRGEMSVAAIHHSIGNPHELIAPTDATPWTGMVSVNIYGQLLSQRLGFETKAEKRMLFQALNFGIPQCLELLNMSSLIPDSLCQEFHDGDADNLKEIDESSARWRFNPLPSRGRIAAAFQALLSPEHQPKFERPAMGDRVSDCRLVRDYLEELKSRCECSDCSIKRGDSGDSILECDTDKFYQRLARITASILALSLFDAIEQCPDSLLLSIPWAYFEVANDLEDAIQTLLENGLPQKVHVRKLLEQAQGLIGHDRSESELGFPAMTSARGQVLFPTLLERRCIIKDGYLSLSCIPGVLRYKNEIYRETETGIDPLLRRGILPLPDVIPPVAAPLNLFPDIETSWAVTKRDNDRLGCTLRVNAKSDGSTYAHLDPMDSLFGLMKGLLLESCPHPPRSTLDEADKFAHYCGPHGESPATPGQAGSHVAVMAVADAEDLRLVSVTGAQFREHEFFVLRGGACMACCLKLCRRAGIDQLIL